MIDELGMIERSVEAPQSGIRRFVQDMIHHIVLFNLNPEVDADDRNWLFDQMRGLTRIPSVRNLAIGRLLEPREEWYRPRLYTEFAYAMTMDFEDEDGLYAYQNDPYHANVAQEIRKRAVVKVVDFVRV